MSAGKDSITQINHLWRQISDLRDGIEEELNAISVSQIGNVESKISILGDAVNLLNNSMGIKGLSIENSSPNEAQPMLMALEPEEEEVKVITNISKNEDGSLLIEGCTIKIPVIDTWNTTI